jgi:hypothetical protein
VLAPYRPGSAPASRSYGYDGQQIASAPSGYPTQQEASDAIDGGAPTTGALPVSRASAGGSSMMPVNARPSRLMGGTGGLY